MRRFYDRYVWVRKIFTWKITSCSSILFNTGEFWNAIWLCQSTVFIPVASAFPQKSLTAFSIIANFCCWMIKFGRENRPISIAFLKRVITSDETWMYDYDAVVKSHSTTNERKHTTFNQTLRFYLLLSINPIYV